jgi:hypothetical protein
MGVDQAGDHGLSVAVHGFGGRIFGVQFLGKPNGLHFIAHHGDCTTRKDVVRSIHGYDGSPG